jgi:hypothetical protein
MDQQTLLPFDTPSNNNNNQIFSNIEKNNQNTLTIRGYINCRLYLYAFAFLSILAIGLALSLIFKIEFLTNLCGSFLIILFFAICGYYVISIRKVEFIKNGNLNQVTLKITKNCCCSKQYPIMLESRYLFYQDNIMLLNTLENPREIDLDQSNIINSPINLITEYQTYPGLEGSYNEIQLKIDQFLGQQKFENKIYDEINKYSGQNQRNYLEDQKKIFANYMKINEYFYTFFYFGSQISYRTDFIFSNDFERLFIGKVYASRYSKTLLINLNEVNTFEMLEKKQDDGDGSNFMTGFLKVMYKNQKTEEIEICRDQRFYLEKFVLLLNGKLNDINEMKKNNYNYTPQY